jgi:hypothetical protein
MSAPSAPNGACRFSLGFAGILVPVFPLLLLPSVLQVQQVTGDLQVSIVDSLGEPVPCVNVVLSGTRVQGVRGGVSDVRGRCTLLALPPGTVSIRVSHAAHQSVIGNDMLI